MFLRELNKYITIEVMLFIKIVSRKFVSLFCTLPWSIPLLMCFTSMISCVKLWVLLSSLWCWNTDFVTVWRQEVLLVLCLPGTFAGNNSQSFFLELDQMRQFNHFLWVKFGRSSMTVTFSLQILYQLHLRRSYRSWCVWKMGYLQFWNRVYSLVVWPYWDW